MALLVMVLIAAFKRTVGEAGAQQARQVIT
jgi:hypothetical protein